MRNFGLMAAPQRSKRCLCTCDLPAFTETGRLAVPFSFLQRFEPLVASIRLKASAGVDFRRVPGASGERQPSSRQGR